eukprot:CAMPEP_0170463940 /NCGR_PEP_ID=MMETSP0123-20130129/8857_1 /TAXON_ID=182087 /ORGANISM="Favella ehrenbergii, Strain Fehren 1" /LENGTH=150 /DNA_ID=CAMNT_0010729485 /DNA_START=186 /DNA_END=638 /DNA_ORIENTATION=+
MGELLLVLADHVEAVAEVGEAGAQVHLVLELLEDFVMVEVRVREQAVQAPHDVVQVLLRVGWDRHSIEVVGVDNCSGVVKSMDHVVNCTAVRLAFMSRGGAQVDELLAAGHFRARFARANAQKLHHEQVQLQDELTNVLVHPHALVNFRG